MPIIKHSIINLSTYSFCPDSVTLFFINFIARIQKRLWKNSAWVYTMKKYLNYLLLLLLFSVSSCVMTRSIFEPAHQPDELVKTAIVRAKSPIYEKGCLITINSVNGEKPMLVESKAIVSPGKVNIVVNIELKKSFSKTRRQYSTKAATSFDFEAKAEHEYIIEAAENSSGLWVWVEDLATKEVVAGNSPSGKTISEEYNSSPDNDIIDIELAE